MVESRHSPDVQKYHGYQSVNLGGEIDLNTNSFIKLFYSKNATVENLFKIFNPIEGWIISNFKLYMVFMLRHVENCSVTAIRTLGSGIRSANFTTALRLKPNRLY